MTTDNELSTQSDEPVLQAPAMQTPSANDTATEELTREDITGRMLKLMLDDKGIGERQIKSEALVQTVPSEHQHRAKEILNDLATDPTFPIFKKPNQRDVYIVPSNQIKTAYRLYEKYTGEAFDDTHSDTAESEPRVEATLQMEWDTVSDVEHVLETADEDIEFDVAYNSYPVEVSIEATEAELEALQPSLADVLRTDVALV